MGTPARADSDEGQPIPSAMHVRDEGPGLAVARFVGRVDVSSVHEQREQLLVLLDKGYKFFVADLTSISFLDSAGMAMLVSLLKRSRQAGGDIRVVQPNDESVRRILKLTRLDLVFNLVERVDTAIETLAKR